MFESKPNKLVTDKDGRSYWVSRSLVTIAFVTWKGKILIVQRGESVIETGKWCLPCGYLDYDETIQQSVGREIWEETGINISEFVNLENLNPIAISSIPKGKKQNVHMDFIIKIDDCYNPEINKDLIDKSETTDVRWIEIKDVDSYNFAFDHNNKIRKYHNL